MSTTATGKNIDVRSFSYLLILISSDLEGKISNGQPWFADAYKWQYDKDGVNLWGAAQKDWKANNRRRSRLKGWPLPNINKRIFVYFLISQQFILDSIDKYLQTFAWDDAKFKRIGTQLGDILKELGQVNNFIGSSY